MLMQLIPKKWADFQHYKDRCPPWIKLHSDLLNDREFMRLPLASKALAPLLWLLASESKDGKFDASIEELEFRLRLSKQDLETGLKSLIDKGFFLDASTMLAPCLQDAIPEAEESRGKTEAETKVEGEKKRAMRFPVDTELSEEWFDFCRKERPDLLPENTFAKFKDYWIAKTGKSATKLDWFATWRNWVREERKPVNQSTGETPYQRTQREKMQAWAPGVAAKPPGYIEPFTLEAENVPFLKGN